MEEKKPSIVKVFAVIIVCGFIGMSCGPLMKMQMAGENGLGALWVACLRGIATWLLFWPWVFLDKNKRQSLKRISKKDLWLCVLSGLLLGVYFLFWVLALKYTSSFNTVTVICSQFIFIALFGFLFLKEKMDRYSVIGGVSAFVGIGFIAFSDLSSVGSITGTLVAVASALAMAAYFVVGRVVRQRMDVITYSAIINTVSAVFLLVLAFMFGGEVRPLTFWDIILIFAIMLFGSGFDHIGPNWAVKYITSETLGVMTLLNPVYTFANAAIVSSLFNQPYEKITPLALTGCIIIIAGIGAYMFLKRQAVKRQEMLIGTAKIETNDA